jgi:hypothetical protein
MMCRGGRGRQNSLLPFSQFPRRYRKLSVQNSFNRLAFSRNSAETGAFRIIQRQAIGKVPSCNEPTCAADISILLFCKFPAETRAVNRALRKAYGIGLCSVEELGSISHSSSPARNHEPSVPSHSSNASSNGQPRLRDRLCLLIRQYNLNPNLVKAYAADFCGAPSLKEANRDLIESFISHLAVAAKENRDGLLCKLNSYAQPVEVKL